MAHDHVSTVKKPLQNSDKGKILHFVTYPVLSSKYYQAVYSEHFPLTCSVRLLSEAFQNVINNIWTSASVIYIKPTTNRLTSRSKLTSKDYS